MNFIGHMIKYPAKPVKHEGLLKDVIRFQFNI